MFWQEDGRSRAMLCWSRTSGIVVLRIFPSRPSVPTTDDNSALGVALSGPLDLSVLHPDANLRRSVRPPHARHSGLRPHVEITEARSRPA
jgi:hypothetical protein